MSVQSLLLLVCIATPLTEGVADRRFLLPLRLPHQEEAVESTSHSEKVVIEPFLQIQLEFVDIGVSNEVSSAQMMSFCSTWHFVRRTHLFSTATTTGNPPSTSPTSLRSLELALSWTMLGFALTPVGPRTIRLFLNCLVPAPFAQSTSAIPQPSLHPQCSGASAFKQPCIAPTVNEIFLSIGVVGRPSPTGIRHFLKRCQCFEGLTST